MATRETAAGRRCPTGVPRPVACALAVLALACGPRPEAARPVVAAPPAEPAAGEPAPPLALLRELAATSTGHERLAALHRLYGALRVRDEPEARAEARTVIEALAASPDLVTWERADAALLELALQRDADHRTADALAAWRRLLAEHPGSPHAADAALAVADAAFADADLAEAEAGYRRVLTYPDATVAPYARYKLAWVHLNLSRHGEAESELRAVVATAADPLRREALRDLPRVYAETGDPARARAYFDALDRGEGARLTLRLADLELDGGRADAAIVVYRQLVGELDPQVTCPARLGLVRAHLMTADRAATVAALEDLVDVHPDGTCAVDAARDSSALAATWERDAARTRARDDRARAVRAWELAAALALDPTAQAECAAALERLRGP